MYSFNRLDTPPPRSRYRPWSPDPNDPLPSASRHAYDDYHQSVQSLRWHREPSDVSVEALDLADYAMTLNRNLYDNPALEFRAHDSYPPSPVTRLLASPESAYTPSLVSPSAFTHFHSATSLSNAAQPLREPQTELRGNDSEIDIARFPPFSHAWYGNNKSPNFSDPLPAPGASMSPFDPAFPTHAYDTNPYNLTPPPSYPYDLNSRSSRDPNVLPWSADTPDVDPNVKEERMRMLEREFGKEGKKDREDETAVGSVDNKGKLITDGPKKRLAVRLAQLLFSLTATVASIYAAGVIKPSSTPPPSGRLPLYVLYVLSIVSFLATTYVFFVYPCCCGRRSKEKDTALQGPGGLMVLPIQSLPGGKKNKRGKKKKGGGSGDAVQVNLIVDPTMFGGDREREGEWDEEVDDEASDFTPSGSNAGPGSPRGRGRLAAKRRGIFAGLAMEAQWKRARKTLKWGMLFDIVSMILWGTEFVLILLGPRCPSSGYDGWCESYNLSTAASCLLCVAFGFSIFFDIKDLYASKVSPRTRT
ncbi:hypothetical protein BKA93DRAFT_927830 [Sparassis latifolia]